MLCHTAKHGSTSRAKMDLNLWVQSSCKQQQHQQQHESQQKSLHRVEMRRWRIRMQNLLYWPVWWDDWWRWAQGFSGVERWATKILNTPRNLWVTDELLYGQRAESIAVRPNSTIASRTIAFVFFVLHAALRPSLLLAEWAPVATALSPDTIVMSSSIKSLLTKLYFLCMDKVLISKN